MSNRTFITVAVVCLLARSAAAQEAPVPQATDSEVAPSPDTTRPPTSGLDLRPPVPQMYERGGLHMSLTSAKQLRIVGITFTALGVVSSIIGYSLVGTIGIQNSGVSYETRLWGSIGGTVLGGMSIGVGAGMWGLADYEIARAEGRAPAFTPQLRAQRGKRLTIAGAILTGIGSALVLGSLIDLAVPEKCSGDLCGLGTILVSGSLSAVGSTFFGAGIPLLAVGADEKKHALAITSLGVSGSSTGGSINLGGRF